METLPTSPSSGTPITCAACGHPLGDRESACLLRDVTRLPEDTTVYLMHRFCASRFTASNDGDWMLFSLRSHEAAWFIPMELPHSAELSTA